MCVTLDRAYVVVFFFFFWNEVIDFSVFISFVHRTGVSI